MKKLNNIFNQAMLTLALACMGVAPAWAQVDLSNFKGTSGAGSQNINNTLTNGKNTLNNIVNFGLMVFAAIGIFIVGLSLFHMWKASKEERESPKGAIVGCIVGSAMTAVALITGLLANTWNL